MIDLKFPNPKGVYSVNIRWTKICYNLWMKNIIQNTHNIFTKHHVFITMGIVLLIAIIVGYGEYRLWGLKQQIILQDRDLAAIFDDKVKNLDDKIASIVEQNNLLNSTVQDQINQTSDLLDQVEQVGDTAAALDKLSKVDPQLLQKYSKVYFLNENYKPADLTSIPSKYTFDRKKDYELYDKVEPFLENMLNDAENDGVDIKVISAYRSFDAQASLKSNYQVTYGAGTANSFSADQGYSEHQLGTTVDFTNTDLGANYETFDTTEAYTWLTKNAYKYGFTLSYPKNNSYYVYEPWHWRFVGEDLAYKLHRQGKYFYDLDQRTINNYLGVFFD